MKQRAQQIRMIIKIIKLLLPSSPYGKKAIESKQCPHALLWMYKFTPLDDHLPSPLGASVWQRAKDSPSKQWFQSTITKSYQRLSPSGQLVEKNKAGRFLQGATSCDKQAFSSNEPVYVWNSLKHIWELGKVFNPPKPSREPRTSKVEIKGKLYQRTRGYLPPRVIQTPHTTSR